MRTSSKLPCRRFTRRSLAVAIASVAVAGGEAFAASYAPWLTQIGVSDAIMSAANWGRGQMLGVVDTGIMANHAAFATGQVSTALSSCAAVTFTCSNGFVDDKGHGTAVAAIAAGNKAYVNASNYGGYVVTAGSVISVAPNANILAQKVLNAAGTGYSTDVANGVRRAADAGAAVINVSITYFNTSDIVSAINYAASKGAFIVWAGGNSSINLLNGANTAGLTPQAISRLLFAGSVNPKSVLSSFSNKPGSGALVATTGGATSYAARWLMAPGEAILAPYIKNGTSAWGYWTGTSMSTPVVSGSLMLLQNTWPILKTNGTTANLLLATTSDLGTTGIDATYGDGLVNLTKAFQPSGTLAVTQLNGTSVAVSSLTGSMISGGALGSLSTLQSKLANYMAFDSYARNFSVDLSGLIKSPSTPATTNPLPTNVNSGPRAVMLRDGTELGFWESPASSRLDHLGEFAYNAETARDPRIGYAMLTSRQGTTTAFGHGYPVQFSYARALYGDDDLARLSSELGVSNLTGLGQGGGLLAYGMKVGESARVAFSWSSSASPSGPAAVWTPRWMTPEASSVGVGVSYRFNSVFTAGFSMGVLNERHGLLGSTYESGSALSLSERNQSLSYGLSAGFNLDRDSSLLFEAGLATTRASSGQGLLAGTSDLQSRSWGVTFQNRNLAAANDRLTFAVKQPLRVSAGRIGVLMPSVDELGVAQYGTEWSSIVPDGRELDFKLAYELPTGKHGKLGLQATYRKDALNVRGSNDAGVGAMWTTRF